jgi:hypothetical protein
MIAIGKRVICRKEKAESLTMLACVVCMGCLAPDERVV